MRSLFTCIIVRYSDATSSPKAYVETCRSIGVVLHRQAVQWNGCIRGHQSINQNCAVLGGKRVKSVFYIEQTVEINSIINSNIVTISECNKETFCESDTLEVVDAPLQTLNMDCEKVFCIAAY